MKNNMLAQLQQIQQNPNQIKQMLYQNGKISKEQFDAMKSMNSFDEIGQYIVNNNIIPNSQLPMLQQKAQQILSMFK